MGPQFLEGVNVSVFRFVWWNVESFAHYAKENADADRWPASLEEHTAKQLRLANALAALSRQESFDLLVLGEATRQAANGLRDLACPGFQVASPALSEGAPAFQVAALYNTAIGTPVVGDFRPTDVPRGTRPMLLLDYRFSPKLLVRFIFCHFTARIGAHSARTREKLATQLSAMIYDFLASAIPEPLEQRHVLVLGDFNEEPYGLMEELLHASRDRGRSRQRHYTDRDIRRARLYNCSWRLLGERQPHPGHAPSGQAAGSYYWREQSEWHTYDQLLVSGSLLSETMPYLDEAGVRVVSGPEFVGPDGRPLAFQYRDGRPIGASDHLPIRGRLQLS